MTSSKSNTWCKGNVYGILWANYGGGYYGDGSTNEVFPSSSGKKWKVIVNRQNINAYDDYTLEVVSSDTNSKPDRKSILNNCFAYSVQETKDTNFEVVFFLKVEMQTPRVLISSGQRRVSIKIEIHCSKVSPELPASSLSARQHMISFIGNMLESDELCDVLIKAKDKTFPAHKCILAAHSKVFNAMFTKDMKEKNTGIIEIKNSDPQAVKEMLKFMYTQEDPVFDNTVTATEVYKISHMYEVQNLFDIAHAYLKDRVNASNVLDTLMLGADYSDVALKDAVICYLTHEPKIKLNSSKCLVVVQRHPSLLEYVLKCLNTFADKS